MRRALLLMEQNLARPIAVAAVAAELGLSARQLERLCRQHVGMGPASLYRQLRMRYANWLIENTDRSVTDIANEAGFADCAHFSRQFKDAYGLSPSTRRLQPQRAANGDAARAPGFRVDCQAALRVRHTSRLPSRSRMPCCRVRPEGRLAFNPSR